MNKKAFTLIELLVVVLIIGILSAVALPQYRKAVFRARISQVFVIYGTYKQAIDAWLLANGWPNENVYFTGTDHSGELDVSMPTIRVSGNFDYTRDKLAVLASCSNVSCIISVGTEDMKGDGFQVQFQRGTNALPQQKTWGLAVMRDGLGAIAQASDHGPEMKIICLWAKEQGNAYTSAVESQCASVGVEVPFE